MPVMAPPLKATSSAGRNSRPRRFGGAHVGAHRNVHPDEAGGTREDSTDQEAEGHQLAERKPDQHEKYGTDQTDGRVLFGQISRSTFLNGFGDFLHARVAGWQRENPLRHCSAIEHRNDRAYQREDQT
jgi:hypothetical protein